MNQETVDDLRSYLIILMHSQDEAGWNYSMAKLADYITTSDSILAKQNFKGDIDIQKNAIFSLKLGSKQQYSQSLNKAISKGMRN